MRAAVLERFNEPYVLKDLPVPAAATGHDLLVRVLAASYCHTDAVFASGAMSRHLPRVGCHEFVGEVLAVGDAVPPSANLPVGTRVGIPGRSYRPCGICYECQHTSGDPLGYSPYCPTAGNLGLTRDGGFQEYCLVDSRQVAPLPEGMEPTQAAPLMCAGLTVWAALHHEKVRKARRVAILGAGGGLGHIGVQFAAHLGKDVLAVEASDTALELLVDIKAQLGSVGANIRIADARKNNVNELKALFQQSPGPAPPSELGVDAVILLPASQKAFDFGIEILRNHGTMVVVSFPTEKLAVSAGDIVFRDINIVGSLVGRNHHIRSMLEYVVENRIRVKVTTFPFGQLNQLVRSSETGTSGKLVVDMQL